MSGVALPSSKKTLLKLIQDVCSELGLGVPTSVIGNYDPNIVQLLALANREGREMFDAGFKNDGWQALRKQATITIAAVSGLTGTFTAGSAVVTGISSTTGITTSMLPYNSSYITPDTTVLSVDSPTQITMSTAATASGTGVSFFCGQTSYDMPSDYNTLMTQTAWDRNFRWQLLGPLSAQEWQVLKSGISPTGPRRRFRIMDNQFVIDPVPGFSTSDNGAIEVFEYYSNGWCQNGLTASSTAQTQFAADTDYYVLDDDTMELGIIWRYLRAKRLSYDEEKNTYDMKVERVMARDGGMRNLPLNAQASGIRLLNQQNVPDSGYGS